MSDPINLALCVEYDGTNFRGWQAQKSPPIRSVETVLKSAIEVIADHEIGLICAGRTDAGVHAQNQIVNFITTAKRSDYAWIMGINSRLPKDCAVKWICEVPHDFHARFSALSRHYRYVIHQSKYRSALTCHYQTHIHTSLDIKAMQMGADFLIGTHDFASFRGSGCQAKTSIRTVFSIDINQEAETITIDIHANAFLHHMVRNIVGVLLVVGIDKEPPIYVRQVLDSLDRTKAGITAPPQGLYLMNVEYPANIRSIPSSRRI